MAKTPIKEIDKLRVEARKKWEETNVFSRLPAIYSVSRKQGQQLLKIGGGLTILEWRTLWDLHEAGTMTIKDLAAIQRSDHSLISRALPKMVDKGLICTARNANDHRQMIVSLTPKGEAAYKKAAPIMEHRRDILNQEFTTEEITIFVNFLDRLENLLHLPARHFTKDLELSE